MKEDSGNKNDKRKKDKERMEIIRRMGEMKAEKQRKSNEEKEVFWLWRFQAY